MYSIHLPLAILMLQRCSSVCWFLHASPSNFCRCRVMVASSVFPEPRTTRVCECVLSLWRRSQEYHRGQHVRLESMQSTRSRFAIRPPCRLAPRNTTNSLLVCSAFTFNALRDRMVHMKQHTHIREIDRCVCGVHPQPDGHGMGRFPALS